MKKTNLIVFLMSVAFIFISILPAFPDDQEKCIVSTGALGKSYYQLINDDGTLSDQQYIGRVPDCFFNSW